MNISEEQLKAISREINTRPNQEGALREMFGDRLGQALQILRERGVVKPDKIEIDKGSPQSQAKVIKLINEGYIEQIIPRSAKELGLDIDNFT